MFLFYQLTFHSFQFIISMKLNQHPLHIVGLSMGGGIGGLYAAKYPEDLSKLTLICPAGKFTGNGSTDLHIIVYLYLFEGLAIMVSTNIPAINSRISPK